ncbi:MAG: hypothetical protein ABIH03_08840, partial [Pseudomonadota bacterium]
MIDTTILWAIIATAAVVLVLMLCAVLGIADVPFNRSGVVQWLSHLLPHLKGSHAGLTDDQKLYAGASLDSYLQYDGSNDTLDLRATNTSALVHVDGYAGVSLRVNDTEVLGIAGTGIESKQNVFLDDSVYALYGNTAAVPDGSIGSNGTDLVIQADNGNDLKLSAATLIYDYIDTTVMRTLSSSGHIFDDNIKLLFGTSGADGQLYSDGT